jgi:adenosine kinase
MTQAHVTRIKARSDIKLGIISPDGRDAMLQHAAQLAQAKIPFIFDPGQGLPMFDGADLRDFVAKASWVAVNDYEGQMLCERTGETLESLSRSHLEGIVVTLGAEGCDLWQQGRCQRVPGIRVDDGVDPTGCGDAFRAPLLYGIEQGWPLERSVALGNRIGATKVAYRGGQNHPVDLAALEA